MLPKTQATRPAALPETGFLRLPQIIGDPKAEPPIPPNPGKKILLVAGNSRWPIPQAGEIRAACYRVAS